ncbi:MAG: sigma-70 family RNA polymerase sigma factor [Candidatus Magasanikbacteria bacterium]|nr:sigma-70 family RNA polymerase sigma factor [Candidatus Magasanikbacteria bacterium]
MTRTVDLVVPHVSYIPSSMHPMLPRNATITVEAESGEANSEVEEISLKDPRVFAVNSKVLTRLIELGYETLGDLTRTTLQTLRDQAIPGNDIGVIRRMMTKFELTLAVSEFAGKTVKQQAVTPDLVRKSDDNPKTILALKSSNPLVVRAAREALVRDNQGFMMKFLQRFRQFCGSDHMGRKNSDRALEFADIISAGLEGMWRAAEKYDARFSFITFAVHWIRACAQRDIHNSGRVRIPAGIYREINRFYAAEKKFERQYTGEALNDAIRAELELTESGFEQLLYAVAVNRGKAKSLSDSPPESNKGDTKLTLEDLLHVGGDGDLTLEADPLGRTSSSEEDQPLFEDVAKQIFDSLRLGDNQRYVLIRRFGLDGKPEETLQEIGDYLNLSRERVRQIETKAKKVVMSMDFPSDVLELITTTFNRGNERFIEKARQLKVTARTEHTKLTRVRPVTQSIEDEGNELSAPMFEGFAHAVAQAVCQYFALDQAKLQTPRPPPEAVYPRLLFAFVLTGEPQPSLPHNSQMQRDAVAIKRTAQQLELAM